MEAEVLWGRCVRKGSTGDKLGPPQQSLPPSLTPGWSEGDWLREGEEEGETDCRE